MFWHIKHKTLNTDICNYLINKSYFECEIKTASRWQQVTVNKWVIAIEQNHLNGWFIQDTQNSAVAVFGIIFVGEIEEKQAIWCLKHTSLN